MFSSHALARSVLLPLSRSRLVRSAALPGLLWSTQPHAHSLSYIVDPTGLGAARRRGEGERERGDDEETSGSNRCRCGESAWLSAPAVAAARARARLAPASGVLEESCRRLSLLENIHPRQSAIFAGLTFLFLFAERVLGVMSLFPCFTFSLRMAGLCNWYFSVEMKYLR
jgi:hypothetical protein